MLSSSVTLVIGALVLLSGCPEHENWFRFQHGYRPGHHHYQPPRGMGQAGSCADAGMPQDDAGMAPDDDAGASQCLPICEGKQCGDDGCAGSCGSCSSSESCDETSGSCVPTLSFGGVYALLERNSCIVCHAGATPRAGLALDSADLAYSMLVNQDSIECQTATSSRKRVLPGSPSDSYLLDKLTGEFLCGGQRMPLGGVPLTDAEILTVQNWIEAGAPR